MPVELPDTFLLFSLLSLTYSLEKLSLGDARAYHLSTAKNELGVVSAESAAGMYIFPHLCLRVSFSDFKKLQTLFTQKKSLMHWNWKSLMIFNFSALALHSFLKHSQATAMVASLRTI